MRSEGLRSGEAGRDPHSPPFPAWNPAKGIRAESKGIPTRARFSAKPETERQWKLLSWHALRDSPPAFRSAASPGERSGCVPVRLAVSAQEFRTLECGLFHCFHREIFRFGSDCGATKPDRPQLALQAAGISCHALFPVSSWRHIRIEFTAVSDTFPTRSAGPRQSPAAAIPAVSPDMVPHIAAPRISVRRLR